jgi:hypothetical protein
MRSPAPSPPLRRLLVPSLAAALLTAACNMGPVEPSLLDGPRVLAVQSTPRSLVGGAPHAITALLWEVPGPLAWQTCPAPWIPGEAITCPTDPVPVGSENPLTLVAPPGVERLWLRLDADAAAGLPPTIRPLGDFGDAPNPTVVSLQTPEGPLPATLRAGATLQLRAVLTDPLGEGLVTNFFTTGGLFEPWRTRDDGLTTLEAPATPGPLTLIAVTRDAATGVGWLQVTLDVVE